MNPYELNPFQVLYVTDSPDPRAFVELFSDIPVIHAAPLFEPGNVVLRGTQGSGKSMLLNLLSPQIRVEYARIAQPFPVPSDHAPFIAAGINLTLSGALNIGQRPIGTSVEEEQALFPLLFADFLNYYVVRDLIQSLEIIGSNSEAFGDLIDTRKFDQCAVKLAGDSCWFGYLQHVRNFKDFRDSVDSRLAAYRSFHQFNADLPPTIQSSKTAIGEPIARAADILKQSGVVRQDTPLFIRIDQVERLHRSDVVRPSLGRSYRQVINKAIGSRDSRVSYRIGTRPYAWDDDLTIYGTNDRLEDLRDFRIVDIDELLRRKESTATWIFPQFAEDAFERRLRFAGCFPIPGPAQSKRPKSALASVFGGSAKPAEAARMYAGTTSAERALNLDERMPANWHQFLTELFRTDPLSATLARAWVIQSGGKGRNRARLEEDPSTTARSWEKPTWKNERIRQALLQLAARCSQRLQWSGSDSVLALSSGNISIFLSICYEVWDTFLRSERQKEPLQRKNPVADGIDGSLQAIGIQTASLRWYEKVSERPKGHDRQRFIDVLGATFRNKLLADESMSYPGHNGVSLTKDELKQDQFVKKFLDEAVDYGDLHDAIHTTKESDRRPRRKWYLAPILSVFFQIPEAHKKEPYYANLSEMRKWLADAGVTDQPTQKRFNLSE